MKKTLAIAACAAGYACAAHAQSSVALYGVINAGFSYASNQHGNSGVSATSGDLQGSHWGFIGAEDLGGGAKAIFRLENGFNLMNGTATQNGREFGYQAYVGLDDQRLGRVTLGRQYDSVVDFLAPLHKPVSNNLAAHPYDNDNLNHGFRVNNSVKYSNEWFGGLRVSGLYGFSNDAGEFANNRAWSAGTSYAMGNLKIAAAYLQVNNTAGSNTDGAVTLSDRTFIAALQRTFGAGATYQAGTAKIDFLWTRSQFDGLKTINGIGSLGITQTNANARFDNFEINTMYRFTPAWTLTGAYTYTAGKLDNRQGNFHPKWNEVSLLLDYACSKRTDVYAEALYQHLASNGSGLTADINRQSPASGDAQTVLALGIRHRF